MRPTVLALLVLGPWLLACAAPPEVDPHARARGVIVVVERPFGTINLDHEMIVQVVDDTISESIGSVAVEFDAYEHVETIAFKMARGVREQLPSHAWIQPTLHPEFQNSLERPRQRLLAKEVWLEEGYSFGTIRVQLAEPEDSATTQIRIVRLR